MKFYFSIKTTLICTILALGMLRMAYWQWTRHLEKIEYINTLEDRFSEPVVSLASLLPAVQADPGRFIHRRVFVSGSFDFSKEMYLRNQRFEGTPGVHVLTPLKLANAEQYVIVNRGFIPLHAYQAGEKFQDKSKIEFTGLLKEGKSEKLFAPKDPPTGKPHGWVQEWLRVNLNKMKQQVAAPLLPLYVEIIPEDGTLDSIVKDNGGKEELLFLPARAAPQEHSSVTQFPVPVFSTVIPAGRHFGYVFEWSFMAMVTLLIGLGLQMRKPRQPKVPDVAPATA